jgi:polyhydroxybutyrate depolymerase
MKYRYHILLLIFFIIPCSCTRYLKDQYAVQEISINHNGVARTCLLYVPRKSPGGRLPLLIVLHGGGGNARRMLSLTKQQFNTLADAKGFYVAYPEGIGGHWNDFRDDPIDYAHQKNIDDTGFISALIDKLAVDYPLDTERVFATGISNGGFMSFRLACELSAKIKAIAAVTASHPVSMEGKCRPARAIHVLILNGTKDPLVPYNGGYVEVLGIKRGRVISTDDSVRFWVAVNKCAGTPAIEDLPDNNSNDGTKVKKISYGPCSGNTRVILFSIEGGGHTWPDGIQYLSKRIVGNTSRQINACDVIWDYFGSIK